MNLNLKSFAQLVQDMGAALQSSATALVDISVGSVARALFEANAGVALWVQWLVLQVLQTTRASTSTGDDLDSWMADFGLSRLPASPSGGSVTFFRYTSSLPASIPVGTIVKTTDGSLSFSVVASSNLSIWDAPSNSYVLPAGIASGVVPVVCNQPGSQGNVVASSIAMIASSLRGIDQVTNSTALSGGRDAEEDNSFRKRFVEYLSSLARGTPAAIRSAVNGVQQGLTLSLIENTSPDGKVFPGQFLVIIDDGSGFPSQDLLSNIGNAVEAVRPIGTSVSVMAPSVIPVSVSATVLLSQTNLQYSQASTSIQQALQTYLTSLAIGRPVTISRIIQVIYAAVPGVENVTDVSLNGSPQDISPTPFQVVKAAAISVTIDGD